jgi:hypothetical protein
MSLFQELTASKMMATVDKEGKLNVVPIGSLNAIDEETLAFADLFGLATRTMKNLEATNKVAVTAFKVATAPPSTAYQVKGTFQGFQTSGPLFDQFAKQLKEATGLDVKGVGTIGIEEVYSASPMEPGKKLA